MKKFVEMLKRLIQKGKVTLWSATDKELDDLTKPNVKEHPGSYGGSRSKGSTYHGIKITIPLPEPESKE